MESIRGRQLSYTYDTGRKALREVDITIREGSFTAILGSNGSGKSTLVRLLDLLLPLQKGTLVVAGLDAAERSNIWKIRRRMGILFQNPDSQFVSSVAEEDTAFGPENYGIAEEEVTVRVDEALCLTGMEAFRKRNPHTLSGGEKQRLALAGLLALNPDILIFDEALSMLDPKGSAELMETIRKTTKGKTVLFITHYADEAVEADNVIIMSKGKIIRIGSPEELLTDITLLEENNLRAPEAVIISDELIRKGIAVSGKALTLSELAEEICHLK